MDDIVIILLLIVLNGVFSMSEIAIISARKTTLSNKEKQGDKGAKVALLLANDPDRFLSTVQIGITLIGILTGIFSGAALSGRLAVLLSHLGLSVGVATPIAQVLIVVVVTYLSIVLGELVPKRIGMSIAEKASITVARPMQLLSKIAAPFVWLLSKSTEVIVSLLGLKGNESKVTEDDIKSMVQEGREDGSVEEVEQDIVERVFMVGDLKVNQLMTHRSDVTCLDVSMGSAAVRDVLGARVYEAYPVVQGSMDKVLGMAHLKELVLALGDDDFSLKDIMRPAVFFYETLSVYKALEQMKEKRISQAFICDEFGAFQGIITLRDILEGLVGNINQQNVEPDITVRSDGKSWLADGQCSLYDFLIFFDCEDLFDNVQQYNTLAGLILEHMKHIPQVGEATTWHGFTFEIVDMDGVRVDKVLITKS